MAPTYETVEQPLDDLYLPYPLDAEEKPPQWKQHEPTTGWMPRFNPGLRDGQPDYTVEGTQRKIWDCTEKFVLVYGERASGKGHIVLHTLVRHCYENSGAIAIIVVKVKRQGDLGGAWDVLVKDILPEWERELGYDHESDPFYSDPKTNTQKDVFLWIRTADGGSSKVVLLSMPVEGFIQDRIKGILFSFAMFDEAQTLESDAYFKYAVQQCGRLKGTDGKTIPLQQMFYVCNPAGPSHWLYKRFFIASGFLEGKTREGYAVFHVPIDENKHNLDPDYYRINIEEAVRNDPIEEARMKRGEWIDRPSGLAIFAQHFKRSVHAFGSSKVGLKPQGHVPVVVSMDPGPANFSIHLYQWVTTAERSLWLVFDEINTVGQHVPYDALMARLARRLRWWEDGTGHPLEYIWVADESAFNQKTSRGTFEAQEIQKELLPHGFTAHLLPCPKGRLSRVARVTMMIEFLNHRQVLISGTCVKTLETMEQLASEAEDADKPGAKYNANAHLTPKEGQPWRHSFDSLTYGMFFHRVRPGAFLPRAQRSMLDQPQMYSAGQGGR